MSASRYHVVAIAGTFDRLHSGHRHFITRAFELSINVLIGLTSDIFVEKKFSISKSQFPMKVKLYKERLVDLELFLKEKNLANRASITSIDDLYGPAVENRELEALIVTRDTERGARLINEKRLQNGHAPLDIRIVSYLEAHDHMRISSTRIRAGDIDRWGHVFADESFKMEPITEKLRSILKEPIGELILESQAEEIVYKLRKDKKIVITVGDVVTKFCNDHSLAPAVAIVDFVINRIPTHHTIQDLGFDISTPVIRVKNPAGHITKSLIQAIQKAYHTKNNTGQNQVIKVEGEEDLTGVPAILLAPLDSVVLYGQPGKGMVLVGVTEEKKNQLISIIQSY